MGITGISYSVGAGRVSVYLLLLSKVLLPGLLYGPAGLCCGKRENERLVKHMATIALSLVVSGPITFPHLAVRAD